MPSRSRPGHPLRPTPRRPASGGGPCRRARRRLDPRPALRAITSGERCSRAGWPTCQLATRGLANCVIGQHGGDALSAHPGADRSGRVGERGRMAKSLYKGRAAGKAPAVCDLHGSGAGGAGRAASSWRGVGVAVRAASQSCVPDPARGARSGGQPDAGLAGGRLPHGRAGRRPWTATGPDWRDRPRPAPAPAPTPGRSFGPRPRRRFAAGERPGAVISSLRAAPCRRPRPGALAAHDEALVRRGALAGPGRRPAGRGHGRHRTRIVRETTAGLPARSRRSRRTR